jgi:eukaryotic-like serine/threonine-protein kinase
MSPALAYCPPVSDVTGNPGQVLAGRYRLVALLGRGGMGCVWRAEHISLGTPMAIKLVHPEVASRPGMLARFLREAQAAARLRSVNVVQILDHGVDEGVPYIAMECLEGESLATRLAREGRLAPAPTALVMTGVCRALAAAHRAGIVHRDLKPDNIFIARDPAGSLVKVLDFGIAKLLDPLGARDTGSTGHRTETGQMLGTPRYMSPEQARAKKTLDGRADIWSLAVITYQCLTGRLPFEASALSELLLQICTDPIPQPSSVAEVPPGFDAWFARATQRDPDARFQTVPDFADALADVLSPGQRWLDALGDSDAIAGQGRGLQPSSAGAATPAHGEPPTETGASLIQTASAPPAPSRRRLWGASAVALVVAMAGMTLLVAVSRAPKAGSRAVASVEASALVATAAPSVIPVTPPASSPTAVAEVRRVNLVVLPSDASVQVDGAAVTPRDGVVEIDGKLGSVHHVRVFKSKLELEGDVSITESGAIPPKMDLGAVKPKAPPRATRLGGFDD